MRLSVITIGELNHLHDTLYRCREELESDFHDQDSYEMIDESLVIVQALLEKAENNNDEQAEDTDLGCGDSTRDSSDI